MVHLRNENSNFVKKKNTLVVLHMLCCFFGTCVFKADRLQMIVVAKNLSVLQLFISRMPKMCAILQLVSAPLMYVLKYVSQEFSFIDQGVITNTCKTELIAIEYRKSGYLKIVCTHSFYYCCYNFRSTGNHNQLLAAIGTTVEIFSMKEENEAGICTLRIKATGRQRFRIKELRRQVDGSVS